MHMSREARAEHGAYMVDYASARRVKAWNSRELLGIWMACALSWIVYMCVPLRHVYARSQGVMHSSMR